MTRPFRLQPPESTSALLRPAILRKLLRRFETRVTLVQAGAGFGKTTALGQAVEQNLVASHGHDIWLGCEPADRDADHLRAGLSESLGLAPDSTLNAIADSIAARSPAPVCVILDDMHEIPAGSTGASLVEQLIQELPANGRVLLASRVEPAVNLARLDAQGRVERLSETDLALGGPDLATLAAAAGRPVDDIKHLGGWPALVALGLREGPVAGFLDEEVLTSLDGEQRHLLSVVVALGGASDALLRSLTGLDPAERLAELPMMNHRDGWFQAHDLWLEIFSADELATTRGAHVRPAIDYLLKHAHAERAVELAFRGGEPDLVVRCLREAIIGGRTEDPETLRYWRASLPPDSPPHPIITHLQGLIEQSIDPTTDRSRAHFEKAADGFTALGDTEAAVSAVAELGFWHHIQRDAPGLMGVAGRMSQLAEAGEPAATPYIEIIGAFVALAQGNPHDMLAAVARARALPMTGRFEAIADWLEFQAREFLGESRVDLADRYLAGAGAIRGTEVIAISARWRAGHIKELLADPDRWAARSGSERARFLTHAWLAAISAGSGDLATARSHLRQATTLAGERGAKQVEITLALPELLIMHEEGRSDEARTAMTALLDRIPVADDTRLSYNGSGALIARLDPEALENLRLPLPDRDIGLGAALRAMDESGTVTSLATVPWPESPGTLVSTLFLRTACEFVCAAWAAGREEAHSTVEWLLDVIGEPARARLRDQTEHPIPEVAAAAKEILAGVPLPPAETRSLLLLGNELLLLGSQESDHDDWRRERVRSLLGYLVIHPESSRDAVMTALWPEASPEASRRNLRSTLNLLLGVLESGRAGGDAAYFVRADGTRIRLSGHDRLDVDVWRFDSLVDEAEQLEADGAPSLAVECLTEATSLYRGDLLGTIHEGEWLHLERQRLHVRFVTAATRCAELLLAHDRVDEAIALATRTIQLEPWSESAHRTLVASHLQRGDRAAAHRAMQRCHEVLEELGGPVDEQTEMLERRLAGS